MTALISLVGMRDPDGEDGSEGSILTIARHLMPGQIRLLPSRGRQPGEGTEPNARLTEARLREILPNVDVRIHPLSLDDPTDYNQIGAALPRAIYDATFGMEGVEFHCAISSGTPQLCIFLMVLLQEKARGVRFWQVRTPRFVTDDRSRIQELDLSFLEQPALSGRFAQAWQSYDFAGAVLLLRERIDRQPLSPGRPLLEWVATLADAYARWDAVDWAEARDALARLRAQAAARSVVAKFRTRLEQQEATAARLAAAKQEDYLTMVDLYWNARRRLAARQYVDALARWRRVLEGSLTATVRSIEGCTINDKGHMTVSGEIEPDWKAWRTKKWGEAAWPPAGSASLDDLLCVVERASRLPKKLGDAVGGAQQARNNSIAAHGMELVTEKQAADALNQLRSLLAVLFPDDAAREPLEQYAFGTEALDWWGRELAPLLDATG